MDALLFVSGAILVGSTCRVMLVEFSTWADEEFTRRNLYLLMVFFILIAVGMLAVKVGL